MWCKVNKKTKEGAGYLNIFQSKSDAKRIWARPKPFYIAATGVRARPNTFYIRAATFLQPDIAFCSAE